MRHRVFTLTVPLLVLVGSAVASTQPPPKAIVGVPISAGTSVVDVRKTLVAAKLSELPITKQFARRREDDAWLCYSVASRVQLFLTYSTTTNTIRDISLLYLSDEPTSKDS